MLVMLRAVWRTLAAGMFLLGLFWLPSDVQSYDQALGPWQRLWALLDREALLWIFALGMFAWLAWIDLRPFIIGRMKKRYPERHAEICKQLANELGELRELAFSAKAWARKTEETPRYRGRYRMLYLHFNRVSGLAGQITYDPETAETVRDFAQMCVIVVGMAEEGGDHRKELDEISALSPPLFEALQSGRGVNRASLPLPQWTLDTVA